MRAYKDYHLLLPSSDSFRRKRSQDQQIRELASTVSLQGNPQSSQQVEIHAEIEILGKNHHAYRKLGITYAFVKAIALDLLTGDEYPINPNQISWYSTWNDYQKRSNSIQVYHPALYDIFTAKELADYSGISLEKIHQMCKSKELQHSRFAGSDYIITWSDARFFLSKPLDSNVRS